MSVPFLSSPSSFLVTPVLFFFLVLKMESCLSQMASCRSFIT